MCIAQFERNKMFGILLLGFLGISDASAHSSHHQVHANHRHVQHQRTSSAINYRWIWIKGHWEIRAGERVWIRGKWILRHTHRPHDNRHRHSRCR